MVPDDTDPRETRKRIERAFRKGKISKTHYESEMTKIDKEMTKREEESANVYFESAFRDNPSAELKEGDIVIRLTCPSCGMTGEQRTGHTDFSVLGKDASGFIYVECPGCAKHLQYDPITGTIKTQRGLLGFFFGIFR